MSRHVRYHRDGSVRMDWYTFCAMKVDKIMATVEANAKVKARHTIRPTARAAGVKEFI